MKILFVGMPFSISSIRWINQVTDKNWDIHFFSSFEYAEIHPDMKNVTYHEYYHQIKIINKNIKYAPIRSLEIYFSNSFLKKIISKCFRVLKLELSRSKTLEKIIKDINPDIIHTLETQHAGYITAECFLTLKKTSKWIHSNWGIDLHFFGRIENHIIKIQQVLKKIDYFIAEGDRDIELARNFGCNAKMYIFPSVGGGFHIESYKLNNIKPSLRNIILLKGTQDIVRRGLFGLRALQRCIDILKGYKIIIYNCSEEVEVASKIFMLQNELQIEIIPESSHEKMLKYNREARISITVNLSDGNPNSMFEAMLCGCFPIQSNTSCADEWITDNINGILVPPEDPDIIEIAIRKALLDNQLVDNASLINFNLISEKLNFNYMKNKTIELYESSI